MPNSIKRSRLGANSERGNTCNVDNNIKRSRNSCYGVGKKRFSITKYIFFGALGTIQGCMVHPLPGDYALRKVSTFQIINNIRCEAKTTVADILTNALANPSARFSSSLTASQLQKLAAIPVETVPDRIPYIKQISPELGANFQRYVDSTIQYRFMFDITESNNWGISGLFTKGGKLNIDGDVNNGLSGKSFSRQAKRVVNLSDTFPSLAKLDCERYDKEFLSAKSEGRKTYSERKNLRYPIVGSIGMNEVMKTFIGLAEAGGQKDNFTDTLTFTTQVGAGLDSSLILAPVVGKWKLTSAIVGASAHRIDKHSLTITISFPQSDLREVQELDGGLIKKSRLQSEYQACVNRLEQRENRFGQLRPRAPDKICEERLEFEENNYRRVPQVLTLDAN